MESGKQTDGEDEMAAHFARPPSSLARLAVPAAADPVSASECEMLWGTTWGDALEIGEGLGRTGA